MNNSSDPMFDRYADLDFTDAKPVAEVPALAKLQDQHGGKPDTPEELRAPDTETHPHKT